MSSNAKILAQKHNESNSTFKGSQFLGPNIESKLDELKSEMVQKIEKELEDSQNARMFISQKYNELCNKISFLSDLDATVTAFRSDVRTIEKRISDLLTRVEDIERRTLLKENSSLASSLLQAQAGMRSPAGGYFYEIIHLNE